MAHLAIYVTQISGCQDDSSFKVNGYARVTGQTDQDPTIVDWFADVPGNATVLGINTAIKDAAIAAAEALNFEIGALDTKTLYGGPSLI